MRVLRSQTLRSRHAKSTQGLAPGTILLLTKEEEFTRAVPLALFDYLRKSRAGAVLSFPSAEEPILPQWLTMIWLMLMVRLAIADIGKATFIDKLKHILRSI